MVTICSFPLFLCIDCWGRLSYLSLLFFGTLHSNGNIFPFLLCFSLLFISQLFVRPPQTTILPFCISFLWWSALTEMVRWSVCLPSDALSQHLPSYLGFSYLGLSLWLLQQSAASACYLERGVSPHGRPSWPWTWSSSSWPSCAWAATAPWRWGCSSWQPPLTSGRGVAPLAAAPDLGHVVACLGLD